VNDLTRRTALIPAAVLALAAPMAEAAPASTPSQDCVIAITADVPGLTIGRDVGTQLRIGARGLTPGAAPQLTASAGTVDDLKPDGEGGYVASYYAPLAGPPQVAIVSAISGKDCGYLALRLSGEVNAVVRARPNVPVDVRMGDEVFGPVRADASGRAVVPVVIPPGVRAVTHGTQGHREDDP